MNGYIILPLPIILYFIGQYINKNPTLEARMQLFLGLTILFGVIYLVYFMIETPVTFYNTKNVKKSKPKRSVTLSDITNNGCHIDNRWKGKMGGGGGDNDSIEGFQNQLCTLNGTGSGFCKREIKSLTTSSNEINITYNNDDVRDRKINNLYGLANFNILR